MNRFVLGCLLVFPLTITAAVDLSADPFFKNPRVQDARMSPDGTIVIMVVEQDGMRYIEAVMPERMKAQALNRLDDDVEVQEMVWLGNRAFMLDVYVPQAKSTYRLIARFELEDGEITDLDVQNFSVAARLIDPLPDDNDFMLLQVDARDVEVSFHGVYRYPLHRGGRITRHFVKRYRADVELPARGTAITDRMHEVRYVFGEERTRPADPGASLDSKEPAETETQETYRQIYYRDPDGPWKRGAELDGRHSYRVVDVAEDDRNLVVITDAVEDVTTVQLFDPITGEFLETLARFDGYDVVSARTDEAGRLETVYYYDEGRLTARHMNELRELEKSLLEEAVAGQNNHVYLINKARGRDRFLAWVFGGTESGQYYYYDRSARSLLDIGASRPWLNGKLSGNVQTISATADDDLPLEGYLTLPAHIEENAKLPLVVIPHGGPMAVRSHSGFNATAQYFAGLGIAVFEPNYRGSGGFGRRFLEEGKGQLGTGIEDDIDRLVSTVLAEHPVDPARICVYGASYGGYSALMAGLRDPERYRCSASFAGPTDLQLSFTSSDWSYSDLVDEVIQWYGHPDDDADDLHARSPAYQAARFSTPLLIAHGTEDYRVDFEHYRRLTRMLDHFNIPYQGMVLDGVGHGFDTWQERARFHEAVAGFLIKHLAAPVVEGR